jgi:hypothetical protein
MDANLTEIWKCEFQNATTEKIVGWLSQNPELVNVRVTVKGKNGRTFERGPLFYASNGLKDLNKVKALVDAGAQLKNGPLGTHWPSSEYEINEYFISQGIDIDQPSYLGFHAMGVTGLDSFYLMMANGMKPNYAWPYNGETLLHVTAREDRDDHLAKAYTLIMAGGNVNATTLSGLGDEPIMDNEHFVRYGKETPLHFAARLGSFQMARLLLAHGADPSQKTVSRMVEPKEFTKWPEGIDTWHVNKVQRLLFEEYEGETPKEMALREGHQIIADWL